jgi:hypothetical protein
METDFSNIFYEKYFNRGNRLIEVSLKNGRKIIGVFISFFLNDFDSNKPYIRRWHIGEEKYKRTLGIDEFGFHICKLIILNYIMSIKFLDDNSQMHFE